MISDEVMAATREILVESLGVSPSEVVPSANLVTDLGAESIDFLDIFESAELRFQIRISQADFTADFRGDSEDDGEMEFNRLLTDSEIELLKSRLPRSTHDRIKSGLRVSDIGHLINVETLATFFESKLAAKRAMAGA